MSELQIREFENPGFDIKLAEHIDALETYSPLLEVDQVNRLRGIIGAHAVEKVVYNETFDLKEEVAQQIAAVRLMREFLMPGGQVKPGTNPRELKEMVSSSATLMGVLMKTHDKILSFDRSRAVELAVSETIKTLSDADRATFMKKLEENLSAIE